VATRALTTSFAGLEAEPRLAGLREVLARGERAEVSGLAGPARLLAALLLTDRPLLVVAPHEREVEELASDLKTLAAELGAGGAVLPFPAPGPAPFRGLPRHPDAALQRAAGLDAARRGALRALVASPAGLLRPSLAASLFATRVLSLRTGDEMTPEILLEALGEGGYRREDPVTAPGQVARRGGIVDVFPPDRDAPVRIELMGDTIESLRRFDPQTQRTTGALESLEAHPLTDAFAPRSVLERLRQALPQRFPGASELGALIEKLDRGLGEEEVAELLPLVPRATVPAWEHLPGAVAVALDPEAVAAEAEAFLARAGEERARRRDALALEPEEALVRPETLSARLETPPALHLREVDPRGRGAHVPCRPVRRYAGDLRSLVADLKAASGTTVLFLGNPGRADRLQDLLREQGLSPGPGSSLQVKVGALSRGFELPEAGLAVLADGDIFPEEVHLHARPRGRGARSFLSDFRDLRIGDLVVHEEHGIGRFEGLETLDVGGGPREYMVLVS